MQKREGDSRRDENLGRCRAFGSVVVGTYRGMRRSKPIGWEGGGEDGGLGPEIEYEAQWWG